MLFLSLSAPLPWDTFSPFLPLHPLHFFYFPDSPHRHSSPVSTTPLRPAPEPTGVSDDARLQRSHERGEEEKGEEEEEAAAAAVEGRAERAELHSGLVANDDDDDAASSPVSDLLPLEALPSGSRVPQWPTNPDSELTSLGKTH